METVQEHVSEGWDNVKRFMGKGLAVLVSTLLLGALVSVVGLVGFRICCVDKVENYEFAYRWDLHKEGKITPITRIDESGKPVMRSGYVVSWPIITKIHTIDLRPMQVCITSIQRVLNCKLVEFDPKGFELFIGWHGRNNYHNTTSSSGDRHSTSFFNQILMAYAYEGSGKNYPFLRIIRELKPEEVQEQRR